MGSKLNNNSSSSSICQLLKFIIPAKNGHPCFLVDGQKRYRRLIDILVNSFSISSARWELYHGTGQIIDGIHTGDPERTSGIRRYQILKIQRQSQMPKSMPMPCHSLRFSNSTQNTRIQEDKTYRVGPAPPANSWQSKQMKKKKMHLSIWLDWCP